MSLSRSNESIRAQVEARLASARIGAVMTSMGGLFEPARGGFKSAPLLQPPISTGMTDTLLKLEQIIMKSGPVSQAEYTQVPNLLRHLRRLLRLYYDAKLSGRKPADFKYCDYQDIGDLGLKLHEFGLFLQLMPVRLRALLRTAPDMETFLLEDPLDIGKWRKEAHHVNETVQADPESDDDDRMRAMELEDTSGKDLAAYYMVFFVADLLVALLLMRPVDDAEKARQTKALEKIVEYSTCPMHRRALGDNLTDAMRPIYWSQKLTVRFAHAGGLPALFDDWAQSMANKICEDAVGKLPSKAWEHQTEASLKGVMAALIHKIEVDGDDVATTPLFARVVHEIYSRYGLEPLERGSTLSSDTIIFFFLHRRISRKPTAYSTPAAMLSLLNKFRNVPPTTRKRHGWMILSISGRWDCLTMYGCGYKGCPERQALLELKERRVRGVRDPVVEDRLFQWGGASKACTKYVSYCSSTCQKADWKTHKLRCKEHAAKNQSEVEVEI